MIKRRSIFALRLAVLILVGSAYSVRSESLDLVPYPREVEVAAGTAVLASLDKIPVTMARPGTQPAEGYELMVKPKGVKITAADAAGAFYAHQTLKQLAKNAPGGGFSVPCCTIRDWPAFAWRGVLFDDCRHFFGKEAVKKTMDAMAAHKLNVFHWHLTEDQAWRLAVPKFPNLVKYGAVREQSEYPDGLGKNHALDGKRYGPYFYTEADVKEILAYAKARHIRVIPEIEMPGHACAALAAYPHLCCRGSIGKRTPWPKWGISRDIYCAGNDETIRFLEQVLDYVVSLFPDKVIHIGGDEAPKDRWNECPKCQARIKAVGVKNARELQGWMTRHFTEYLAKKGRRTIGWDEILEAEIPSETLVMWWHGKRHDLVLNAAKKGHDIVVCPSGNCYFDHRQVPPEEHQKLGYGYPTRRKNDLTLKVAYAFDPYGGHAEAKENIIGVQCNLWSEHILTPSELEWKMWPRAAATAEIGWSGASAHPWKDFQRRAAADMERMFAAGYNVCKSNPKSN